MATKEEIGEGIAKYIRLHYDASIAASEISSDVILRFLDSQGVVLKVERELPDSILSPSVLEERANEFPDYGGGDWEQNVARVQRRHTEIVIEAAGFTAVDSLI